MKLTCEIYVENETESTACGSVAEALLINQSMVGSRIRVCVKDEEDSDGPMLEADDAKLI